ncbi:hypothetical protein FRC04_003965 [Tulasnella sp. 424]|nr:hypothetical protein FRC04_003965 [Tulasnella sp. 424]KAG8965436.1 hypothetical protein FRC05_003273 [Tulasnella sp. 425]
MQRRNQATDPRTSGERVVRVCSEARCSSIHTLPPELLVITFHITLDTLPPNIPYSVALRKLRLVSVHWSRVIDQAASLWATTSCLDPEEAVKMALRKSAGALLSVACVCNYRTKPWDYAALVVPHCRRWSSLRAETGHSQRILALLSGKTPNLRSLTVGPRPLSFGLNLVSVNEPMQLDQTTCQLRELVVRCCSLSGFTFTFPHLRRLDLINVLPQGPSVDQVVGVLAGCAETLETLVLVRCAIRPCHERLDQEKRLSMSKLKKVTIRSVYEASVAQILDSIELSSSTESLVYTTDRELVGSRVLGHIVSLTAEIAKLGQGRVLRIASVEPTVYFRPAASSTKPFAEFYKAHSAKPCDSTAHGSISIGPRRITPALGTA